MANAPITPQITVLEAKDVALILKISERTVRRMAQTKQIPAKRVGKRWRFTEESLRLYLGAEVA